MFWISWINVIIFWVMRPFLTNEIIDVANCVIEIHGVQPEELDGAGAT